MPMLNFSVLEIFRVERLFQKLWPILYNRAKLDLRSTKDFLRPVSRTKAGNRDGALTLVRLSITFLNKLVSDIGEVPTRDSSSRLILKVSDLSRVKAK